MRATRFEFRYRAFIIFALFGVAFSLFNFKDLPLGVVLARWLFAHAGELSQNTWYHAVYGFATLVVVIAAAIRTWGTSYLRADVMRDPRIHSERLVADGPYRYVRNPLYIGTVLLGAGMGVMAPTWGFVVLVGGLFVFCLRLVLREESELAETQGESYRAYCAAVPRILPALRARVPAAGNTPKIAEGLKGEIFLWILALAEGAFAATYNLKVFWIIFVVAFMPGTLFRLVQKLRKVPAQAAP